MTVNSQLNQFEFSQADICREYVTPSIQAAGWGDSPFKTAEQRSFTDGLIVLTGRTAKRHERKRTAETALLFLQLIMRKFRRQHTGPTAVVIPN